LSLKIAPWFAAVSIIMDFIITGSNNDQTNKNTNAGIEHHKTR
jgi:hypothetical protein